MKIVNASNIPDALFRYLSQDLYDHDEKGDSLSATEILNPVQIIVLKRRYWGMLEVDAADQLWKLLGSGVHAILEKEEGIEKIERLKVTVLGREVSGRWDRIFNGEITDYKVTSAYTVMYGSRAHEWKLQLSIYRWLYWRVKGVLLKERGYIVALLRDWSEKNLGGKYPKASAVQIGLDLFTLEDTEKFVKAQVAAITEAEKKQDSDLPPCTDDDRWYNKKKKVYLRCVKYCEVAKHCKQLARERELEAIEDAEVLI